MFKNCYREFKKKLEINKGIKLPNKNLLQLRDL